MRAWARPVATRYLSGTYLGIKTKSSLAALVTLPPPNLKAALMTGPNDVVGTMFTTIRNRFFVFESPPVHHSSPPGCAQHTCSTWALTERACATGTIHLPCLSCHLSSVVHAVGTYGLVYILPRSTWTSENPTSHCNV